MMGKFQHLFITGVILLGFSSETLAEVIEKSSDHLLVQNSGGKVIYQDITRVDGKEFRSVNWAKTEDAEARYLAKKINEVRVKHAPTGAMSSARVPAAIVASVLRQTVLKNLLTKAVAGGRIAAGIGSGPVGWALTAATAYELVAPTLAGHGYVYDAKYGNFFSEDVNVYCVAVVGLCTDQQSQETVLNSRAVYADLKNPTPEMLKEKLCKKLNRDHFGFDVGVKNVAVDWRWDEKNQRCQVQFEMLESYGFSSAGSKNWYQSREVEKVPKVKKPITQSEFDAIIGPAADASPTRYVNATADENGVVPDVTVSPNVTVPNGTVVTIGPYTDSDGQPKQVTVTFRTANGETTVSVNVTPRPDLTPNSPSAPSASPNTSGQSGPSGSPNSSGQTSPQTGGQTGSQTGSEASPQTGGQTSGQTGSEVSPETDGEPDKKDEDKPKDGSFLCNLFPDILACDKQPEAGEEPSLEIPEKVVNVDFQPASVFSETAECPAPVQFTISIMGSSQVFAYSYEKPCMVAERLRYLLITMAWVVAGFFCIRTVSREI